MVTRLEMSFSLEKRCFTSFESLVYRRMENQVVVVIPHFVLVPVIAVGHHLLKVVLVVRREVHEFEVVTIKRARVKLVGKRIFPEVSHAYAPLKRRGLVKNRNHGDFIHCDVVWVDSGEVKKLTHFNLRIREHLTKICQKPETDNRLCLKLYRLLTIHYSPVRYSYIDFVELSDKIATG